MVVKSGLYGYLIPPQERVNFQVLAQQIPRMLVSGLFYKGKIYLAISISLILPYTLMAEYLYTFVCF